MSDIETLLNHHINAFKLPKPEREYRFHSTRRWRFDFCWPAKKLAVECEGGVWTNGRHTRGSGFTKDIEKYNEAGLLGWLVLRFTSDSIKSGKAIQLLERALKEKTRC